MLGMSIVSLDSGFFSPLLSLLSTLPLPARGTHRSSVDRLSVQPQSPLGINDNNISLGDGVDLDARMNDWLMGSRSFFGDADDLDSSASRTDDWLMGSRSFAVVRGWG